MFCPNYEKSMTFEEKPLFPTLALQKPEPESQKKIFSITAIIIIIVSLIVLKTVPLKNNSSEDFTFKPATEADYPLVPQDYTIRSHDSATTSLIAKIGWTISGSYSEAKNNPFSFYIYAPDGKTAIFTKTGSSIGTFSFIADVDGSYKIYMFNPSSGFSGSEAEPTITVTLRLCVYDEF